MILTVLILDIAGGIWELASDCSVKRYGPAPGRYISFAASGCWFGLYLLDEDGKVFRVADSSDTVRVDFPSKISHIWGCFGSQSVMHDLIAKGVDGNIYALDLDFRGKFRISTYPVVGDICGVYLGKFTLMLLNSKGEVYADLISVHHQGFQMIPTSGPVKNMQGHYCVVANGDWYTVPSNRKLEYNEGHIMLKSYGLTVAFNSSSRWCYVQNTTTAFNTAHITPSAVYQTSRGIYVISE